MIMNMKPFANNSFFSKNLYFYLAIVGGGLLFAPIDAYVDMLDIQEHEAVATALSVFFMLAIFAGRYVVQVWAANLISIPKLFLATIAVLMLVCCIWLYFHVRFSFGRRTGIIFFIPLMFLGAASGALVKVIHSVTQNQLRNAQSEASHNKSELHLLQ